MRLQRLLVSLLFASFLIVVMAACGGGPPTAPLVTSPGISVQITKDSCPSVEVQAGMQINWTNQDTVDRAVILERMNEQGVLVDSGGTDLLQPGDVFSVTLNEAGRYTYYCSQDRSVSGAIIVLPVSYPYP